MTWIVAMATPWNYCFGLSDVRVTLADGTERDCLQKIYPIANSLAMGFAGSVLIGMSMEPIFRIERVRALERIAPIIVRATSYRPQVA